MDEALPPIVGAEGEEIYQRISAEIRETNSEKANEFEQNWRTYLAFFAMNDDDRLSKAKEFYAFVSLTFGEQFAADKVPQLVRLVQDAGKRQALHNAATQASSAPEPVTTQATDGGSGLMGGIFGGLAAVTNVVVGQGARGVSFLAETANSTYAAQQQAKRDAEQAKIRTPTYYDLEQHPIAEIKEMLAEFDFWKDVEKDKAVLERCIEKVGAQCSPGESVVKAWHVQGKGSQLGLEVSLCVVLTSQNYYRVTYSGSSVTGVTRIDFNDVLNCHLVEGKPGVMRVVLSGVGRGQSFAVEVTRAALGDKIADLLTQDFVELPPTGGGLEPGAVIGDMLKGFQLVHRRYITPPENVAAISRETARAFHTEFKGSPAGTPTNATANAPGPAAVAAPGGLFGGAAATK